MRTKQGYWISLILMVCLASVLIAVPAFCGRPADTMREHGLREIDFQVKEIGDLQVYFYQRMLGEATVQGDFIVYQYDLETQELVKRIEHWRDDLPEALPPLGITREEAEMMVEGEVLFTRLKIIAPDSPVYPIEPTPMNPCWVVRSEVNGRQKVSVIDAVDGTFLGYGLAPPFDAFSLGGPDWGDSIPCDEYYYDPYALNAKGWFDLMGYSTQAVSNPAEGTIQGHIQNRTTALFYELGHGDSHTFLHTCPDENQITDEEVEAWIADYPRMPFTFLGSCGGMCDTSDNTLSYEFRKGTDVGAVTVGYCNMAFAGCAECWDNAIGWQDWFFIMCSAGMTARAAYESAIAAFPMCADVPCIRFAGDDALRLVPPLLRDPNYPPVALCKDVNVAANADCEAWANIDNGSYDPDGDPIVLAQTPPEPYPLGTTLVTLTVDDDRGGTATCTAYVTVVDTTPPEITCPADITVDCTDHCGTPPDDPQLAAFFAGASAVDNCDDDLEIASYSPICFPVGPSTVNFTATDDGGNVGLCPAVVTVQDTVPPELSIELSRYVLWPPNHKMATIAVTWVVSDICDDSPEVTLLGITTSEAEEGLGDGDFPDDIQGDDVGTADEEFELRSERSALGDGRIYTVTYGAEDGSGNTTTVSAEVRVPHDRAGLAMASTGFSALGDALLPGVEEYRVVIRGMSDLQMSENDGVIVPRAYVGNHIDAIAPLSHRYYFADGDGYVDLELTYDARATIALQAVSGDMYPVGLHYDRTDGTSYLVSDIFALGAPLGGSAGVTPDTRNADDATVSIELFRPIPNPTNGTTRMAYSVSTSNGAQVSISIYNVTGQRVRDIVDAYQGIGVYDAVWDGRNNNDVPVPSGMYFYRSVIGDRTRTSRVTLVR